MHNSSDLVLFTFGPIQPFIAASRRTQDLAVSSLILSSLSHAGLSYITENPDTEPIFPMQGAENWEKRLPNRLVFLTSEGQGKIQAEEVEKRIKGRWNNIAVAVRSYLAEKTSDTSWFKDWDTQVEEWLEFYWVTVPWDGRDQTYQHAFQTLNLAIDARKAVRSVRPTPQSGTKGALVGTLSAIGVEQDIWREISSKVSKVQLKDNEVLSAIGAIKRFADQAEVPGIDLGRFPSTGSIAVSSFKQEILENWISLEPQVAEFVTAVDDLGLMTFSKPEPFTRHLKSSQGDPDKNKLLQLDGNYFFRDFFTLEKVNANRKDTLGDMETSDQTASLIKAGSKSLTALFDKIASLPSEISISISKPNAYYAALVMDGDHVGQMIDNAGSLEKHKEISRTMSSTANDFQKIVEEDHTGILVYSGGDDVLALLPITCALDVAKEIREKFQKNMQTIGVEADMSGGVAIMHNQSPLETILQEARKAEHQAKETYGRSCLVVSVLKRSGENLSAAMNWSDDPQYDPPISDLIHYFSMGWLSTKFVYDLRSEINALVENLPGLELEIKRLAKRHIDPDVQKSTQPQIDVDLFADRLLKLIPLMPHEKMIQAMVDWMDWLMIARFNAKGERA